MQLPAERIAPRIWAMCMKGPSALSASLFLPPGCCQVAWIYDKVTDTATQSFTLRGPICDSSAYERLATLSLDSAFDDKTGW